MNRTILIGRLAKDPEAFANTNGVERSRVSVAVRDRSSNNEEKTHFIPCIA
jgi:single-stranded DNA-binding protein